MISIKKNSFFYKKKLKKLPNDKSMCNPSLQHLAFRGISIYLIPLIDMFITKYFVESNSGLPINISPKKKIIITYPKNLFYFFILKLKL